MNLQKHLDEHNALGLIRTTRKIGNTVELNPSNLGGYSSAALAIADVPSGGTLKLIGDYDIAVHGAISLSYAIEIIGSGWAYNEAGAQIGRKGTKIINTGGSPAANSILFSGATQTRMDNIRISNLTITHHGAGAAVLIQNAIYTHINDLDLQMEQIGYSGIEIDPVLPNGDGFFTRISRCAVRHFTTYGIRLKGKGSQDFIEYCNIGTSKITGTPICIDIFGGDKHVKKTECGGSGGTVNVTGIRLQSTAAYQPTLTADATGNTFEDIVFEACGNCFDINPGNTLSYVTGATFRNCQWQPGSTGTIFMKMDYAKNCSIEHLQSYGGGNARTATLMNLSANTSNIVFHLQDKTLAGVPVATNTALLNIIDAGVNNSIIYNSATDKDLININSVLPTNTKAKVLFPYNNIMSSGTGYDMVRSLSAQQFLYPSYKTPETIVPIANCKIWLSASNLSTLYKDTGKTQPVTTNGDVVQAWVDNNLAVRTTNSFIKATNPPVYHSNANGLGIPGVYFDGTLDRCLVGPILDIIGSAITIIAIVTTDPSIVLSGSAQHSPIGRYWRSTALGFKAELDGAFNMYSVITTSGAIAGPVSNHGLNSPCPGKMYTMYVAYDDADTVSTRIGANVENSPTTSDTGNGTISNGTTNWNWAIGAAHNGVGGSTDIMHGWIHEIMVFDVKLTKAQIDELCLPFLMKTKTRSLQ